MPYGQNDKDIQQAVKVHNEARKEVGVDKLIWSLELQNDATIYAKELLKKSIIIIDYMPDYFDIACNFTSQEFINKTDAIIKESENHGVKKFLAVSSTISDFKTIAELRKSYPNKIFSSAGIHPHNATEVSGLDPSELEKEILFYKPNVIGETGLDYFRNLSPRDLQIQSFEFHIQIAIENALPLFLHQRDAHEDFVSVLKAFKSKLPKLVVHCFTATY